MNEEEFNEGWGSAWGEDESPFNICDEDGDGALSEDEYNRGVFNSYDKDGSGFIEEPEFGDVGDDMGDGGFWDVRGLAGFGCVPPSVHAADLVVMHALHVLAGYHHLTAPEPGAA